MRKIRYVVLVTLSLVVTACGGTPPISHSSSPTPASSVTSDSTQPIDNLYKFPENAPCAGPEFMSTITSLQSSGRDTVAACYLGTHEFDGYGSVTNDYVIPFVRVRLVDGNDAPDASAVGDYIRVLGPPSWTTATTEPCNTIQPQECLLTTDVNLWAWQDGLGPLTVASKNLYLNVPIPIHSHADTTQIRLLLCADTACSTFSQLH